MSNLDDDDDDGWSEDLWRIYLGTANEKVKDFSMFSQVHDIVDRLCEVYGVMSLNSCCCYTYSDKQTRWNAEKSQISFMFKMVN